MYVSRRYVHGWDPEWERFFDLARSHEESSGPSGHREKE